jgi:hypothetical protein
MVRVRITNPPASRCFAERNPGRYSGLFVLGGSRLAQDALIARRIRGEGGLTIGFNHVHFRGASPNIDVAGRTNTEPDTLIVHRKNSDFYIIGEFNRLPNFSTQDEHDSSIADSELQAKGFRFFEGGTSGDDDLPGLPRVNIDEEWSVWLRLQRGATVLLLNVKNEINGVIEGI